MPLSRRVQPYATGETAPPRVQLATCCLLASQQLIRQARTCVSQPFPGRTKEPFFFSRDRIQRLDRWPQRLVLSGWVPFRASLFFAFIPAGYLGGGRRSVISVKTETYDLWRMYLLLGGPYLSQRPASHNSANWPHAGR